MTVHPVFLSEKSELNPNDKPKKHEKAEKPPKPRLSGIWQVFVDLVVKNWPNPPEKSELHNQNISALFCDRISSLW